MTSNFGAVGSGVLWGRFFGLMGWWVVFGGVLVHGCMQRRVWCMDGFVIFEINLHYHSN